MTTFQDLRQMQDPESGVRRELEGADFSIVPATPPETFAIRVRLVGVWAFSDGQVVGATRIIDGSYGLRFLKAPSRKTESVFQEHGVRELPVPSNGGKLRKVTTTEVLDAIYGVLIQDHGRRVEPPSIMTLIDQHLLFGDWQAPLAQRSRTGRVGGRLVEAT